MYKLQVKRGISGQVYWVPVGEYPTLARCASELLVCGYWLDARVLDENGTIYPVKEVDMIDEDGTEWVDLSF